MTGPETGLLPSSVSENDRIKFGEEAHKRQLARYGSAHAYSLKIMEYIRLLKDAQDGRLSPVREYLHKIDPDENLGLLIAKLETCAQWLHFRLDKTTGKYSLHNTSRCHKDLLCPFCAIMRGIKYHFHYKPRFEAVQVAQPHLIPVFITLTIKNGFDLNERVEHLFRSLKRFKDKRRNKKSGGRCVTEFSKIAGAIGSYEISYSEKHGWHPHVHMIAFIEEYIDREALSREWLGITGDSKIVDVRKIDTENLSQSLGEVFKYALKFQSLTPEQTFECYTVLKNRKKLFSLGVLHGVKLEEPETKAEKPPFDELFAYRFLDGEYKLQYHKTLAELEAIARRFDS